MRRGLIVAGAFAFVVVLTVVVIVAGGHGKHLVPPAQQTIDVATPAMVQQKAAAGVADCPAPQTTDGGLPAVTLPCLGGGRDVDLAALKGPLLINIFQAYCAPCRKEMPALEAFHQQHADVPILGIDEVDWMAPAALSQAIQRGVTYPMVADPDGKLRSTSLRTPGYPYTFLLTPEGKLTLLRSGGFTSASEIEDALAQAGVTP